MPQPRVPRWAVILGIASALGLFSAFTAYQVVRLVDQKPQPLLLLLGLNFGYWYSWAILAPLVLYLARRFSFERGAWLRSLPIHAAAILVVTFLHVVMSQWISSQVIQHFWTPSPSDMKLQASWWARVWRTYLMSLDWEMMTYWAIVGFHHAVVYYGQAQDRTLRASQLETRLAEAQLQALQRQLHPHFLFNTLNAISALMHRDVEAADTMLAKLSDLLRMALDQPGVQEVPLKDELDFLQKYLEIEQARFGDRLSVRYDIAPETLDALVPNLLLQPLVENSVRHAVAVRIEPGTIEVTARRVADRLELQVRDNGPGLPKGRVPGNGSGVGLANTRSRLEHLYGAAHSLAFAEPPAGGLAVVVTIPFHADDVGEIIDEDVHEHVEGVA
jgi:two-component system, LytTR family, sensor kinase